MGYPIPGWRGYTVGFGPVVAPSVSVTGTVSASGGVTGQQKFFPDAGTFESGGPLTMTSSRSYARYVGQAPRDITAADLHIYLHSGAAVAGAGGASLNWAEAAIASGPVPTALQASLNLTILAAVSFDAEAQALSATTLITKTVSSFSLAKDLGIWLITACAYETTNKSMRFVLGADVVGMSRLRSSCQPSANLNTPLAFTTTAPVASVQPYLTMLIT